MKYKHILKKIAGMEKRLSVDNPSDILHDIFELAKKPFLEEREKNRIYCKRYRETHRERYNETRKLWQRKYTQRMKERKDDNTSKPASLEQR